jgi:hypothetical protein
MICVRTTARSKARSLKPSSLFGDHFVVWQILQRISPDNALPQRQIAGKSSLTQETCLAVFSFSAREGESLTFTETGIQDYSKRHTSGSEPVMMVATIYCRTMRNWYKGTAMPCPNQPRS